MQTRKSRLQYRMVYKYMYYDIYQDQAHSKDYDQLCIHDF
jgi:hypothetical protein